MPHVWGYPMISAPRKMVKNCGWATITQPLILLSVGGNFITFIFSLPFFPFLGETHNLSSGLTICHGILLSPDIHPAEITDIFVQKVIWWVFDFYPQWKWEGREKWVHRKKEADFRRVEMRTLLSSILASSFALYFSDILELGNSCIGVSFKNESDACHSQSRWTSHLPHGSTFPSSN